MDFERRIQEASQHVDQTKGAWDAAKKETGIAQADYNASFTTAPDYQTMLEKSRLKQEEQYEIPALKSEWEESKARVDSIKSEIDNLSISVLGEFRSSGLMATQDRYEKSLKSQNEKLSKQFNHYSAGYELSSARYQDSVDKAFSSSIDVANKNYDNYWNLVRVKMDKWQRSIKDADEWSSMYYKSQSQLSSVQSEQRIWQIQQETIRMQREFEEWRNNFAAQQRASTANAKIAAANSAEARARKDAAVQERWKKDVALFQQGKMSSSQFTRNMDAGLYRT